MIVLVCGGRDYKDIETANFVLDALHKEHKFTLLIQGGAKGADLFARAWARSRGVKFETEDANWEKHGNAAGPIRNELMLTMYSPNLVVAFPGGPGTEDMVRKSKAHGVDVYRVPE